MFKKYLDFALRQELKSSFMMESKKKKKIP